MIRSLYTATAGMASEMESMELLSNNVANTNTVGFKQDFDSMLRQGANPLSYGMGGQVLGTGVLSVQSGVDLSQGMLQNTGSPYDVALQGPGMFALQSPTGTTYTRNGRFNVSETGQIVSESGAAVLDVNGSPLVVSDPGNGQVLIKLDGTVQAGDTVIGKIGVFNAPGWQKGGNALYTPTGGTPTVTSTTQMRQGMLEQGNIDLVRTMSAIMTAERSYEAASQLQRTEDQMIQQSANDIGRLS